MDSPGMIMRMPGIGSQYLMGYYDSNKNMFDEAKTYKVTLPKGIPAAATVTTSVYTGRAEVVGKRPNRRERPDADRELGPPPLI
jgi:hypothetical protein